MQRKKTCAIETAVAMSNLIHFVHKALDVTHPLKILVCNEGKSELGATPDDTSRTTFPKSLEALLSPWSDTCRNMSITLEDGGSAIGKSRSGV